MSYVVWDIETDSAQTDWATIIELGAILLDDNFKEKDRFSVRCRMPQDRVPSATALCINKSNVDLITKGNLCLLYTSPSPRDGLLSRMPSSA